MTRYAMQELFERTQDSFKLTIAGFAEIEKMLNEALSEAFDGNLPRELRRAHFDTRLALAQALNLLPAELRDPIRTLARIRHDLAHGKHLELGQAEARELWSALRQLTPEVDERLPRFIEEQPGIILTSFLLLLEVALRASFDEARERRAELAAALRERWFRPLTGDELETFLRDEEVRRQLEDDG